jgi:hypothetical protein
MWMESGYHAHRQLQPRGRSNEHETFNDISIVASAFGRPEKARPNLSKIDAFQFSRHFTGPSIILNEMAGLVGASQRLVAQIRMNNAPGCFKEAK